MLSLTGYAHAPRHAVLTVYGIQKMQLHHQRRRSSATKIPVIDILR